VLRYFIMAMKTFLLYALLGLTLGLGACERRTLQVRHVLERAAALSEAEQYQDAARLYQKALALDPQCEEAALQVALIFDDCLKDKSNAVVAYEHYLTIAKNDAARAKAQQWLASARQAETVPAPASETMVAPTTADRRATAEQLTLKEQQFEEMRRQLIERYETRLGALNAELGAAQTRLQQMERLLAVDATVTNATYVPTLLARLASNEFVIADLQEKIALQERPAPAPQMDEQAKIAALQRQLEYAQARARLSDSYIASNVALTLACATLTRTVATLEEQRTERGDLALQADTNDLSSLQRTLAAYTKPGTDDGEMLPTGLRELQQQYQSLRQKYLDEVEYRRKLGNMVVRLQNEGGPAVRAQTTTPAPSAARGTPARPSVTVQPLPGARPVATASVRVPSAAPAPRSASARPAPAPLEPVTFAMTDAHASTARRTYAVQAGDSLMKIARDMYGDASLWTKLFYENRDTLDRPNQLRVGQVLRVP